MKRFVLFVLLLTTCKAVVAQHNRHCEAGVYLTTDDFINGRLSFKIDPGAPGYKLEIPVPADWTLIVKIVTPDTVMRFKPGTIFGYADCNKTFRYYAGGDLYAPEDFYRIEENGPLVIYTAVFVSMGEYFYSKTPGSAIHRLNLKNLRRDFKDQPQFLDAAKRLKRKELRGNLAKLDNNGAFTINKLYSEMVASHP
jgi:hypothetical protein